MGGGEAGWGWEGSSAGSSGVAAGGSMAGGSMVGGSMAGGSAGGSAVPQGSKLVPESPPRPLKRKRSDGKHVGNAGKDGKGLPMMRAEPALAPPPGTGRSVAKRRVGAGIQGIGRRTSSRPLPVPDASGFAAADEEGGYAIVGGAKPAVQPRVVPGSDFIVPESPQKPSRPTPSLIHPSQKRQKPLSPATTLAPATIPATTPATTPAVPLIPVPHARPGATGSSSPIEFVESSSPE